MLFFLEDYPHLLSFITTVFFTLHVGGGLKGECFWFYHLHLIWHMF